jgi:hypothetical protein
MGDSPFPSPDSPCLRLRRSGGGGEQRRAARCGALTALRAYRLRRSRRRRYTGHRHYGGDEEGRVLAGHGRSQAGGTTLHLLGVRRDCVTRKLNSVGDLRIHRGFVQESQVGFPNKMKIRSFMF